MKTAVNLFELIRADQLRAEATRLKQASDLLNEAAAVLTPGKKKPVKRELSTAARKRIAQAQKIRWAKWKAKKAE